MSYDSLGDRMKSFENSYRISLPIRMPVIIRVDGKAFHSYTKGCKRPFDSGLVDCMNFTAIQLCKEIQGCQIAYVQSDEISLLITNYQDINTQSWFDNNLQKMISVSAAIASVTFTQNSDMIWGEDCGPEGDGYPNCRPIIKPAYFDSRAFILPKEDVCNYFLWRQQDTTRNSAQMLARSFYSHKECEDKNNSELQDMCWLKGSNWNDCPTQQKRGRCIIKQMQTKQGSNPKTGEVFVAERSEWIVDNEIPIFSQDRNYIEQYVYSTKSGEDNE